jgi:hypothetical protein
MPRLDRAAAAGLALIAASAGFAKEKAQEPRERKVCRTVHMPGRITPERICRKVERPAPQAGARRDGSPPSGADGKSN